MTTREIRDEILGNAEEFDKDLKKGFKGLTGLEREYLESLKNSMYKAVDELDKEIWN